MKPLFDIKKTAINSEWKVLKIKRVLDTPITDGPHETPELLDEGVPFLSAESVKKGKLDFNLKRGYISQEDHEKYIKKCKPQRHDIFMIKSGATTGNVAMVETDEEFSIWSPLALIRADKDKVIPKYLYYFISSTAFREQVEISWSFGTQQNIGMKVIENLFISVPPLNVQKKLVQYMENKVFQIDKLTEMKELKISLLEQQRQSIITEAVTKGLNPNVKMKESGVEWIGEIPEHWEEKKIKYLFYESNERNFNEDATLLSLFTSIGVKPRSEMEEKGNKAQTVINYKIVRKNDIVVNKLLAWMGAIGLSEYNGVTSPDYDVYRPLNSEKVEELYYHYYFRNHYFKGDCFKFGRGIMMMRWRTYPEQLKSIVVPVPPKEEQIQIANYIEYKEKELALTIKNIERSIEKLKEYRQALIYEAVTGKIDVRELELD